MNAVVKTLASINEADLSSIPVAPWQVYQLGLEVNKLTEKMYHLLKANYSGTSNGNDKWLIYNRKEAELIKTNCKMFNSLQMMKQQEFINLENEGAAESVKHVYAM